jgi:hypothetical protein
MKNRVTHQHDDLQKKITEKKLEFGNENWDLTKQNKVIYPSERCGFLHMIQKRKLESKQLKS